MTERRLTDGGFGNDRSKRPRRITYDVDDEPPSEAVVRAVAALTNTSPLDLEPLYDAVDPDYLDGIFEGADPDANRENGSFSFTFNGCRVTVTHDEVYVRVIDGETPE